MADNKQQTILIKKADGTKVRVSLEEFKKMRAGNEEPSHSPRRARQGGQVGNEEPVKRNEDDKVSNAKAQISNQVPMTSVKNDIVDAKKNIAVVQNEKPTVVLVKEEQKPIVQDDLMVETPHELATFTPVHDIFVDEAAANFEWKNSDSESLLAVDAPEV